MRGEAVAEIPADGAPVFPPLPGLPFAPYRACPSPRTGPALRPVPGLLYSPDELFASLSEDGYEETPDALSYAWFERTKADRDVHASMLRAVHDDSVSDALDELLAGARVVGDGDASRLERG